MLSTFLLLGVLVLGAALVQIYQEKERLQRTLSRYESLISREDTERQLDSNIYFKQDELEQLLGEQEQLNGQIRFLKQQTSELEEESYLQSLGFYEPKYSFIRSEDYQRYFDQITEERKQMVKDDTAAICHKEWTVGEDVKKGRKMINDYLKVIREAFDTVCDAAIYEAKTSNINRLRKRITSNFERLRKSSAILECQIADKYLNLRLRELDVKYELEMKKQEEKEEQKEKDRIIREQKKEREALEKARQEEEEAAERKRHYQEEREKIRQEMTKAVGKQLEELDRQKSRYEALIAKAKKDEEDSIERRRGLKSGTIYILSSIGSLEKDVYRIFMTQNSEPDKYVRNMNPYVPFPFNIRFKIYSEDVSLTLQQLHDRFNTRRVNTVNLKREFFQVSLEEIRKVAYAIRSETTGFRINVQEFEDIPLENEYLRTLASRAKE